MLSIRQRLSLTFGVMALMLMSATALVWIAIDRLTTSHQQTLVNTIPMTIKADQFSDLVGQLVHEVLELQYATSEGARWEQLFEVNQKEKLVKNSFTALFDDAGEETYPLQQALDEELRELRQGIYQVDNHVQQLIESRQLKNIWSAKIEEKQKQFLMAITPLVNLAWNEVNAIQLDDQFGTGHPKQVDRLRRLYSTIMASTQLSQKLQAALLQTDLKQLKRLEREGKRLWRRVVKNVNVSVENQEPISKETQALSDLFQLFQLQQQHIEHLKQSRVMAEHLEKVEEEIRTEMVRLKQAVQHQVNDSTEDTNQLLQQGRGWIALFTLFFVLVASFSGWYVYRRVGGGLREMIDTTRKLSNGFLSINIPFRNRHDELGDMANALEIFRKQAQERNQLADALKRSQQDLEQRVEQRTADLSHEIERHKVTEKKLEQSARYKTEFIANMSHEIRTPMNAILGLNNLLLQSELNGKQRNFLENQQSSAQTLLRLLNDILDISRIESGKMEVENRPFSLDQLLNTLHATVYSGLAMEKGLQVTIEREEHIPDHLLGDEHRLLQVLINLCSNGIKFTEKGGVKIVVSPVEATTEQYLLRFAVEDSGIGMSNEVQNRVFEAFVQADSSTTRRFGGTGLGLAISQRLVQLMGGSGIEVESVEGEGSTFSFELSFDITASTGVASPKVSPEVVSIDQLQRLMKDKTVLLVDDHAANRLVVGIMLEDMGVKVSESEGGREALQWLQRNGIPDLILMDMRMPGMDGIETTREISRRYPDLASPIVALTAESIEERRSEAMAVGMAGFLSKPVDPDLFEALMIQLFSEGQSEVEYGASQVKLPDVELQRHPDPIEFTEDPVLRTYFKQEVGECFDEVQSTHDIDTIERFAIDLLIAAQQKDASQCVEWANNLRTQVENMDVVGMNQSLEQFARFVEEQ